MGNVTDLVSRLRKRVGDNPPPEHSLAQVCEDADVQEIITQAVAEFSAHRPDTAMRLLTLTTASTYEWPTGVLGITRLDIQDGRRLAEGVVAWDFLEEEYVRTGDYVLDMGYRVVTFTMANASDLAGTVIELYCNVVHTIPATVLAEAATPSTLSDEETDIAMLRAEAIYRERMMDRLFRLAAVGDGSTQNHELALKFMSDRIEALNAEFQERAPAAHLMRR